jgi:hypothetical protein
LRADEKYKKPLRAYDKYVTGVYYQNTDLKSRITPEKQEILDALREGYPIALSAKDLMNEHGIEESSAHNLSKELVRDNIIIRTTGKDAESKRIVKKYCFEDYNFFLNSKEGYIFPFAPGYVQYIRDFLETYDNIRNKEFEDEVHDKLMDFLIDALSKKKIKPNVHRLDTLSKKKIKPNVHRLDVGCGYDHEARDFIRATLLRLIDGLELNRRYINFIGEELKIIDEIRHKELMSDSQWWSKSAEIPHGRGSLDQVPAKLRLADISKFLDGLPAQLYFMGERYLVKGEHYLQQIVLDYIIKKYPEKIKEIQDEMGGNFISRNKFYTKQRGSRKISSGYYVEIKSPRDRMIRNCDRILKLVGLGRLTEVITLNYQK